MKTPLFITATGRAVGKTIVTLGLMNELARGEESVGFVKPIGVARVRQGREGLDLDAMLIEKTCALRENIKDMCPVTLSPAEWPKTSDEDVEKMMTMVREAYARVSENRKLMVVEGSGNAALGSFLGVSNAQIAAELGCRAVLVAAYGTMGDNPFDAAALSREYFRAHGVDVLGVVMNRVPADRLEAYGNYAEEQLDRLGLKLLGMVPEEPMLRTFRFLQVSEYLDGELLCGAQGAESVISTVRVGAMTPHRALQYFTKNSLIITPGDREDIIVTACACATRAPGSPSGLVLSGSQRPHERIIELLEQSGIPTFLADEDSYTVASKIHDMPLRIQPTDADKIDRVQQLVLDHVDVEAIVSQL